MQLLIFTKHAIEKMDGVGVDKEEVKRVLAEGMKWKEEGKNRLHARMGGLEVVWTKDEEATIVITVYLAGGNE